MLSNAGELSRKTGGYEELSRELHSLYERYGWYPNPKPDILILPPNGKIVFDKTEIPFLVFSSIHGCPERGVVPGFRLHVYGFRAKIVSMRFFNFSTAIELTLLVNNRLVRVESRNLVEGLAYLFFPSILRDIEKDRVVIQGEKDFHDFVDTVVFDGLELSHDPRTRMVRIEELSKWMVNGVVVLEQYRGHGFGYVGVGYFSDNIYLSVYSDHLHPDFEVQICCTRSQSKPCVSYNAIQRLPAFKKVLRAVEKAEKTLSMFREYARKSFWGLRSWVNLLSRQRF